MNLCGSHPALIPHIATPRRIIACGPATVYPRATIGLMHPFADLTFATATPVSRTGLPASPWTAVLPTARSRKPAARARLRSDQTRS